MFSYNSNTGVELVSVAVSFNLEESTAPADIVESINSILQNSNVSINMVEELQVLAFQPSCKYISYVNM